MKSKGLLSLFTQKAYRGIIASPGFFPQKTDKYLLTSLATVSATITHSYSTNIEDEHIELIIFSLFQTRCCGAGVNITGRTGGQSWGTPDTQ